MTFEEYIDYVNGNYKSKKPNGDPKHPETRRLYLKPTYMGPTVSVARQYKKRSNSERNL